MDNEKYKWYLSVKLQALEYRNKPRELVQYIKKNKVYFPTVTQESLDDITRELDDLNKQEQDTK